MMEGTYRLELIQPASYGAHIAAVGVCAIGAVDGTGGQKRNAQRGEVAYNVGPQGSCLLRAIHIGRSAPAVGIVGFCMLPQPT